MPEPPESRRAGSVAADSAWYLEGYVDSGKRAWRTTLRALPLRVGRQPQMDLQLLSESVSAVHAEIFAHANELWIRDLSSTNGTFVNDRRIADRERLRHGDLVRFADLEFRLMRYVVPEEEGASVTATLDCREFALVMADHAPEIDRILETGAVISLFQPIVDLRDASTLGWELLSRGELGGFETTPQELLHAAERVGREVELSELCRRHGIRRAASLSARPLVFVNCHPAELTDVPRLVGSLTRLLESADSSLGLVLEIHEAAITDAARLAELDAGLRAIGVEIAFDDFGIGQSRLAELATTPPAYIKFDIAFVHGIDRGSDRQRSVLRGLLDVARDIGARSIAEGIENAEELAACRELGFDYGQGFHLARPSRVEDGA